ncbi:MAG: DUF523 domain-containing protein [Thermotogae bacterium]|nr:DUF523 domain-containing protein [Kosmotoga sp.]MBO8166162.1 DUF523 domain-containing protein [Kosmotoga sp.]MCD6159401.1 DUF523 domain-containing protein [Kosmotoga sp.]RKX51009.1 MAG: DUF523 domain-containing protein [Thermotogota bacterium]
MKRILVSACLFGINCTYNGKNNLNYRIFSLMNNFSLIPVCPEQLAGLPTPRPRAEITGGKGWAPGSRVVNEFGVDVTRAFERGAEETLKIARLFEVELAILKSKSPSCGTQHVYDGTFSSILIPGVGVTAALLRENGIEVLSEDEIEYFIGS